MKMKIEALNFKVTTGKKEKCSQCGSKVNGQKGYLKLDLYYKWYRIKTCMNICAECLEKIIKEYENNKTKAKKKYMELVKKRMLIALGK